MVASKKHLRVRDSRDRLIDILGFGETSPVRDVPVLVDQLVVPLNLSAKIPIEETQPDTVYKLWHRTDDQQIDRASGVPAQELGNDATIHIESPSMIEDDSYRIRAVKTTTGRWAYLHHIAEIKIGLDIYLRAWIRSGELLDPSVDVAGETDPRIVDHGSEVEVEIASSQEGVDYRLVLVDGDDVIELSQNDVRGTLGTIVLVSKPVTDDMDIRILATRTFDPSENLDPQSDLLEVVLPLRVRAHAGLAVSVTPGIIIDYQGDATVVIEDSQPGVDYRLYARMIPDRDFVYAPGDGILEIPTEGDRVVFIKRPAEASQELDREAGRASFEPIGAAVRGDGENLSIGLGELAEDSMVLIEARKEHLDRDGAERPSTALLHQSPTILVRPNPAPALRFEVIVDSDHTRGAVQVSGGQAGVYYYLRETLDGDDLGRPAYFHKRDYDDPDENKGIGQLAIGVDGAIRRAHWTRLAMPAMPGVGAAELGDTLMIGEMRTVRSMARETRARSAPLSPIVLTPELAVGAALHAHAVKAMTGLSAAVSKTGRIAALPAISVDDVSADEVRNVRILIAESKAGDSYQVMRNGAAIGPTRSGDGQELSFPIPPPARESVFDLVVSRPADTGLAVVRVARITVAGGSSAESADPADPADPAESA